MTSKWQSIKSDNKMLEGALMVGCWSVTIRLTSQGLLHSSIASCAHGIPQAMDAPATPNTVVRWC
jgi:hypothetical protein